MAVTAPRARPGWRSLLPAPGRRLLAVLVGAVLLAQALLLAHISIHQYDSFDLSLDFGVFDQAWHQIAHGHLDPANTLQGLSFWRDHGEAVMWPLSLLYWVDPNDGLTLLGVQDLSFVVGLGAGVSWLWAVADKRRASPAAVVACTVLLLVLGAVDPWMYRTAYQDFHLEATGAALTLLAGRDAWCGHPRRAALWSVLALATGDVAGTYLAAMGLGLAVFAAHARRAGTAMAVAGVAWVALLAAAHADAGSQLDTFGYLAGTSTLPAGARGLLDVAGGVVAHPHRLYHRLHQVRNQIWHNLIPIGTVGLLAPLLVVPLLAVLLVNGASDDRVFILPGFQNAALYVFGPLATALVVLRVGGRGGVRTVLAVVVAVAIAVPTVRYDRHELRHRKEIPFKVAAADADALQRVRSLTPAGAEVIASFGVVGRFAGRQWVYPLERGGVQIPLRAHQVEVVLAPGAGNQPLPEAYFRAFAARLVRTHAAKIYASSVVQAYLYTPPPGQATISFP